MIPGRLLAALVGLSLLVSGLAFAAPYDGRWARPHVLKSYKDRGLSQNIRVHMVRPSTSGKSSQVAVETTASGRVQLFNVHRGTGTVSATPTGLIEQPLSRRIAHRMNHRRDGTFSGVHRSGLSRSMKTYKFTSKASADWTYVSPKTGNALLLQ
jgi:hypothetical protein